MLTRTSMTVLRSMQLRQPSDNLILMSDSIKRYSLHSLTQINLHQHDGTSVKQQIYFWESQKPLKKVTFEDPANVDDVSDIEENTDSTEVSSDDSDVQLVVAYGISLLLISCRCRCLSIPSG